MFFSIDTPDVIERVSNLFAGHPTLIQGFNMFLPAGYRTECPPNGGSGMSVTVTTPSGTTTTHAGTSMNNLSRVASGAPTLPPLAGIPWAQGPPMVGGPPHTPDIGPNPFDVSTGPASGKHAAAGPPAEFNHAIQFVNMIKLRFTQEPETYKQFLEILQKYQKEQQPYQEVGISASQKLTMLTNTLHSRYFIRCLPSSKGPQIS